jgi:hypothetical protein
MADLRHFIRDVARDFLGGLDDSQLAKIVHEVLNGVSR